MELKEYTDSELRVELDRRQRERSARAGKVRCRDCAFAAKANTCTWRVCLGMDGRRITIFSPGVWRKCDKYKEKD